MHDHVGHDAAQTLIILILVGAMDPAESSNARLLRDIVSAGEFRRRVPDRRPE